MSICIRRHLGSENTEVLSEPYVLLRNVSERERLIYGNTSSLLFMLPTAQTVTWVERMIALGLEKLLTLCYTNE